MKQRFSTDRKGRVEFPQVQRIVNTGFSGFRIGLLSVGVLVASVAGAQTPAVQKGLPPTPLTFTKVFAPDTIGGFRSGHHRSRLGLDAHVRH